MGRRKRGNKEQSESQDSEENKTQQQPKTAELQGQNRGAQAGTSGTQGQDRGGAGESQTGHQSAVGFQRENVSQGAAAWQGQDRGRGGPPGNYNRGGRGSRGQFRGRGGSQGDGGGSQSGHQGAVGFQRETVSQGAAAWQGQDRGRGLSSGDYDRGGRGSRGQFRGRGGSQITGDSQKQYGDDKESQRTDPQGQYRGGQQHRGGREAQGQYQASGPQGQYRGGRGQSRGQGRGQGAWGSNRGQYQDGGRGRGRGHGVTSPARELYSSLVEEQSQVGSEPSSSLQRPSVSRDEATRSQMAALKIEGDKNIHVLHKISTPGTVGRRIPITTNHFELKLGKVRKVIHYDIDFRPDRPKKLFRDAYLLFKSLHFRDCNPAFDGRKNVYSANELPFEDSISGTVIVSEEGMRDKEFVVTMKKVSVVDLEAIGHFLSQATRGCIVNEPMEAIQALDIILRHSLSFSNINVGSSFFPPASIGQKRFDLGSGMELYKGFFQSVSLGWKPFLNIDVANKAFPKSQSAINLLIELFSWEEIQIPLNRWNTERFGKYIKGLRIEYVLPGKPSSVKRYRVNTIDSSASVLRFNYNNQQVTVEEYFHLAYDIQLQYPHLPCLWVGSLSREQKIFLPCEFCTILPDQAIARKLDADQTTKMIRQCATNTQARIETIENSLNRAKYNKDDVVNEFGLLISNEFTKLEARVLIPPRLQYQPGCVDVRKGVWRATKFLKSVEVREWTVLYLVKPRSGDMLEESLITGARQLGMRMNSAKKPFKQLETRDRDFFKLLKEYFKTNQKLDIIFVVIPDDQMVYSYVKQASEIAIGCLTQCLKSFTVQRKLTAATIGNILLKVNTKLNGANHVLGKRPVIMDKPTMVMGADVTHPGPDSTEPSVAAVTATCDLDASKYNLSWRLQPPRVEIIQDLENITKEKILCYKEKAGIFPARIVMYRDGVSNGEFERVLQVELLAIRGACMQINQSYKPAITFIVVQKRHHTRFFPTNSSDSDDKNGNVPAGTCVDTEIVHPMRQNFFLVSHASIQGVAKPTKYVTLHDDSDFTNDDLECLTYHLCHMFARCTRSVSYPAPTYYAHLAAARGKAYILTRQVNLDRLQQEQDRMEVKKNIIKDLPMFFI